jgi:hypothetical protein
MAFGLSAGEDGWVYYVMAIPAAGAILVLIPFLSQPRPFAIGVGHRIFSKMSAEELRMAAARMKELADGKKLTLPGPGKWSMWEEDKDASLWKAMQTVPGFSNLGDALVMHTNEGVTTINWGGPLDGYWGIRIQSPKVERYERDEEFIQMQPDMAIFMRD